MRVVAGLGNPGERYERTRHNAGFMAVDLLAARARAVGRVAGDVWLADARIGDEAVLLARPLAYMNRSGPPLARILAQAGGSPAELVVLVDDVALELGVVRVRERGSHGGHNGLRSIDEALGTSEFARVRVGVRDPGLPPEGLPGDLAEYVLAEFPAQHAEPLRSALALAADAAECLVREGAAVAMNRFNGRRA